jgi:cytochrome bd-type quinol oxidase subunit 2
MVMILLRAAYILYLIVLPATCVFALWRGGRDERAATLALLGGIAGTHIAWLFGSNWQKPELGIMAVDAALFVAFVAVAHRSRRFWPIWIAAAQFAGVITHLAVVIHPNVVTELYRLTQPFWVFPILGGIAYGTWTGRRMNTSTYA